MRSLPVISISISAPCYASTCRYFATCIPHPDRSITCECPTSCPNIPDVGQVCGSNGQTYESHCALRMDVCRKQIDVTAKNTGRCGKCVFSE